MCTYFVNSWQPEMIQERVECLGPLQVVDPMLGDALLKLTSLRGKYVLFVVFYGAQHNVSTAELIRDQFFLLYNAIAVKNILFKKKHFILCSFPPCGCRSWSDPRFCELYQSFRSEGVFILGVCNEFPDSIKEWFAGIEAQRPLPIR
jgi:hypothetical protein